MAISNPFNPMKVPDFNGDGRTDLVGFDFKTDRLEITLVSTLVSDGRSRGSSFFEPAFKGGQAPKLSDFNGDQKTDLLWRNEETGQNVIWYLDGVSILAAETTRPLQGAWGSTIADFDGDGRSDLFWYNSNLGEYQLWLMNGTEVRTRTSGTIESGLEVAIADFNADGRADLFLRNSTTGSNTIWTFEPETLTVQSETLEPKFFTWTAEIIDFNGDGRSDVFWRDRLTEQTQVWTWTEIGLQPNPEAIALPSVGGDFVIRTGDFDDNGRTDFLVRNPSSGQNQVWLNQETGVESLQIADQDPSFVPQIGDFDGDRFSDIRWTSTDSSATWFSDGLLPSPTPDTLSLRLSFPQLEQLQSIMIGNT